MKMAWLHQQKRQELVLFLNGWGMDGGPVAHLGSNDFDVIMLYDYRDLTLPTDFDNILQNYSNRHLVAWSMGVWVGQKKFQGFKQCFESTLAINGTLCPIDDEYGIPQKIFRSTLEGFDEKTRIKFYRRMCREKSNLKQFLSCQPQRSVMEQKEELNFLAENVECFGLEQSIYDEVLISDYDWVMPSENQVRFWENHQQHHIAGFHYLFPLFQSWDHIVRFSDVGHAL